MEQKEIKNLVAFTYYGEDLSVVQHAIDEGIDAVLAVIQKHDDILTRDEKPSAEDPEEKALRLKIGKGLVPVVTADQAVKNLLKVPEAERASYFLFFGINIGFKYARQLSGLGFNGNFPTEEDRIFEEDRDKGKQFVKDNYPGLKVAEVHEFKKIDEAITFLQTTEDSWVLKGYDDLCETIVPSTKDPAKNATQITAALQKGQKDYEKAGFLLEKMIIDPIEITPQCVFYDGKPVYYSLDIELKKKGAGDTGPNVGCAANIILPIDEDDPVTKIAFPEAVHEMARNRKGAFIWDASILIDPKDGTLYFGEFCSNRFGWDSIQTEMTMAGGVKKYLEAIVSGKPPFQEDTYGFAVRLFNKKSDVVIDIENEVKPYAWPMYVYGNKDGKVVTTGYSDDALVVTGSGEDVMQAICSAYDTIEHGISFNDALYRPKFDITSREYPAAIFNRLNYASAQGLIDEQPMKEEGGNMDSGVDADELLMKLMGPVRDLIRDMMVRQHRDLEEMHMQELDNANRGYARKLRDLMNEADD